MNAFQAALLNHLGVYLHFVFDLKVIGNLHRDYPVPQSLRELVCHELRVVAFVGMGDDSFVGVNRAEPLHLD